MNQDQYRGAMAILTYIYNTSGVKFAADVFGANSHEDYLREKSEDYAQSPVRAIGMLDEAHRGKLFAIAWERFGR